MWYVTFMYEVLSLKLQMYWTCVNDDYKLSFQPQDPHMDVPFTPRTMQNIVADLCSFILREIVPSTGDYFDHEGELANNKFRVLTDIAGLDLKKGTYRRYMVERKTLKCIYVILWIMYDLMCIYL